MTFKRIGTPEKAQILKFKCIQCGHETITLMNGLCNLCHSQDYFKKLAESMEKHRKECEDNGVPCKFICN
jgi:hypothetical protein